MPRPSIRRRVVFCAWVVLALGPAASRSLTAGEPRPAPVAALAPRKAGAEALALRRMAPGTSRGAEPARSLTGPFAAIVLALAAIGWAGWTVRRARDGQRAAPGMLHVVGRTQLSPKHAVYLLRAGDRFLIIGTGAGASPTLLGEMPTGGGAA
jgi:flagellar biogenesis protein FliO